MTETQRIKISQLRLDGGTQPRSSMDADVVSNYMEAMIDGASFPAVVVFYDGTDYWLADGFHRVNAAQKAQFLDIEAEVCQGTRRDAVLHSVGANATHGLHRSNADKRRAVMTLLNDPEWHGWADREIARRCGVSHNFVSSLRRDCHPMTVGSERTGGDGRTINTANIGKKRAREPQWAGDAPDPDFDETPPAGMAPEPSAPAPQPEPSPGPGLGDFYTPIMSKPAAAVAEATVPGVVQPTPPAEPSALEQLRIKLYEALAADGIDETRAVIQEALLLLDAAGVASPQEALPW